MKRVAAAVRASFGYFSVLPLGGDASHKAPDGAALAVLPIVGATLGAIAGTVGLGAARFVPQPVAASLALGTGIALTGAVHLDGFLDGCDAFFASVPADRRLEILGDPHHGTFALAGLAAITSVSYASLAALPPRRFPLALAFGGALARAAVVPWAFTFRHARRPGDGPAYVMPHAAAVLGVQCVVLMFGGAWLARSAAILVPVALVAAAAIECWCAKRLGGGLVGDAYGFAIVLVEVAILAVLAADLA